MSRRPTAAQAVRIPLVVGLLMSTGPPMEPFVRGMMELRIGAVLGPWIVMVLIGLAAAVLILVGRDRRHPPAVLVVEAAVAGVLGFVPPVQWVAWFGFTDLVASTGALYGPFGFMQPLGIVWLATVALTASRQARRRRPVTDPDAA